MKPRRDATIREHRFTRIDDAGRWTCCFCGAWISDEMMIEIRASAFSFGRALAMIGPCHDNMRKAGLN